ncbi:MAG: YybS family protein [Deltaproteobacteria bacterium]
MIDFVKSSLATITLFLAYMLLMFAGPLAGVLVPFPVLFYSLKNGRGVGIATVALVTVGLLFLTPAAALFYLFQCGIFALLLAEFLSRGKGAVKSITYTLLINMLAVSGLALSYGFWQGVDVNGLVVKGIRAATNQTALFYQQNGLKGEDLEALRSILAQTAEFTAIAYPALLLILLGAVACLNLFLLKKASKRFLTPLVFDDFSRFKNPDQMIWVLIAAGFALMLNDVLVTKVALNILLVTLSLYFIQGLSITSYFFKKYPVPGFLKILFYLMLVIQPYLTVLVAAVGVIDLWCGFRTPKIRENL